MGAGEDFQVIHRGPQVGRVPIGERERCGGVLGGIGDTEDAGGGAEAAREAEAVVGFAERGGGCAGEAVLQSFDGEDGRTACGVVVERDFGVLQGAADAVGAAFGGVVAVAEGGE